MRRALFGLVAAAALFLAGCSSDDTVDRGELVDQFTNAGFTQEQAECFADEIGEISREELEDPSSLFDKGAAAGEACVDELGDIPVPEGLDPSVSIPDISIPDISIPDISLPEG